MDFIYYQFRHGNVVVPRANQIAMETLLLRGRKLRSPYAYVGKAPSDTDYRRFTLLGFPAWITRP